MDFLKTFGPIIGGIAPTIATALGGPLAGMAVRAISTALLGHGNGTEADIMAAMGQATPDQLASLKKIDADFKVQMKSLDIDLDRISAADRDSARNMQSQTKSFLVPMLAVLIISGFLFVIGLKIYGIQMPSDPMIADLVTTLRDGVMLVLAFYFGSSAGSQRKDELIYNSTPTQ
jgi:hypothetical protein